ncbi:hypothetical protein TIFTF001_009633 [Ficus carica]|uniref:F-box domain-containing protein n=1 Tax=Ficus carica TaxID=3494 RepID=A0AA87ZWT2_FICCA|nr:hypothetical protein TIFTF001_009633 [Ficus carica]
MHDAKGEDQEPNTAKVDRLSELPDNVIHYFLSLVPTVDAVQMSILSKRWRSQKPCKFVGKCFTLRKNNLLNVTDTTITKVKLWTAYSWSRTCSWLRLVAKSNRKELDLEMPWFGKHLPVELPVLESLTIDYCNELRNTKICSLPLKHIILKVVTNEHPFQALATNVRLVAKSNIKELDLELPWRRRNLFPLESVRLDDHDFHNLLLGCCSLEKLLVKHCHYLSNPKVSSSSLKFLEIDSSYTNDSSNTNDFCEAFQVEAINLESFALIFPDELRRAHDAPLPTVKHLKVTTHRSFLRYSGLQDSLFWAFPTLETMRIRHKKQWTQSLKNGTATTR